MNGNLEISGLARQERNDEGGHESQESEIEAEKEYAAVEQLLDRQNIHTMQQQV